jgi:universal stress protein E
LLLVKPTGRADYRHVAAAIDPFHTHDKPASLDETILIQADEIARAFEARLSAIYCLAPPTEIVAMASRKTLPALEAQAELEGRSKAAVADLLSRVGIGLVAVRVSRGTPSEVLPRFITDEAVDLLVMGALSRGRIGQLVIGTTAADVLHSVGCDVLVVKPPAFLAAAAARLRSEPLTERAHPI